MPQNHLQITAVTHSYSDTTNEREKITCLQEVQNQLLYRLFYMMHDSINILSFCITVCQRCESRQRVAVWRGQKVEQKMKMMDTPPETSINMPWSKPFRPRVLPQSDAQVVRWMETYCMYSRRGCEADLSRNMKHASSWLNHFSTQDKCFTEPGHDKALTTPVSCEEVVVSCVNSV